MSDMADMVNDDYPGEDLRDTDEGLCSSCLHYDWPTCGRDLKQRTWSDSCDGWEASDDE